MFHRAFARPLAIVALTLMFLIPTASRADLTSVSISGPGGSGSAEIDPSDKSSAGASIDFTSIDKINIAVAVDSAGFYDIYFNPFVPGGSGIANQTGETWSTFLFQGAGLDSGGFSGSYFSSVAQGPDFVWFGPGTGLPTSETFFADFELHATEAGSFSIVAKPNEPNPEMIGVPEPNSLVIVIGIGIGTGALFLARITRNSSTW